MTRDGNRGDESIDIAVTTLVVHVLNIISSIVINY